MPRLRPIPSSFAMMDFVTSPGFPARKSCRSRVCVSSCIALPQVRTQFSKSRRPCAERKKSKWKSCTVGKTVRISTCLLFSSPEPKAQVSFSYQNLSVVRRSVVVVVNFLHFHLLLQNHWTNFNQTWHKASLGVGDSSLFK